jgi:ABC-type uncharacterized transport system ATPase subunit
MTTTFAPADVILRLECVTKHYGDLVAVDSLSLDNRRGEIPGFLGPNAAGLVDFKITPLDAAWSGLCFRKRPRRRA